MWLFAADNTTRKFIQKLVIHKVFGIVIMACIFTSTVTLAFEQPLEDPKS